MVNEQPSPSSASLSWPLAPGSKLARKHPVQVVSEADVPDLPPENASAEEKARILKERRRIKERIREQQRDRSSRCRPSAAEESARRAKQREGRR